MNARKGKGGFPWVAGLVVLAAAGAVVGGYTLLGDEQSSAATDGEVFAAAQGPLTISVTETGTIQAREQVVITNQVEGRTEIIFIVEEGTIVSEGDLLVELDSSQLEDQQINQEISVQNAEAAFIRSRENRAVADSQAESDVSKAELDHRFAREDKTKYIEGEFPKEKKELESRITLANEELERAEDRLEGSERLWAEKLIAETELEGDRLSRNRAQLDYELAVANLELLEKYTYPRRIDELESNIEQTRLALDRVRRRASADIVQAEAELRAAEAEFNRQEDRLEKIVDQISKTKIYSPTSGMAIYATSVNSNRWDETRLEAGYQAREREELIYLPTASSLMAEVEIAEAALEKVRVGQRVRVTIPAVPGREFMGTVARIAPLPNEGGWWNPGINGYDTEIHLDGEIEGVRTGMSCEAEIVIAEFDDAVYVPVQSVVRSGGRSAVFVRNEAGALERRIVGVGLDNNVMVKIDEGLEPGEEVALTPSLREFGDDDEQPEPEVAGAGGGTTTRASYRRGG